MQLLVNVRVPTVGSLFCGIGRADRTLEIDLAAMLQIGHGRVVPLVSDRT